MFLPTVGKHSLNNKEAKIFYFTGWIIWDATTVGFIFPITLDNFHGFLTFFSIPNHPCTSQIVSFVENKRRNGCTKLRWCKAHIEYDSLEFSLNGAELSLNSGNSENLRNHWSMNWVQYKDLLCYLCLCGLVVSSLSLTQEILGSSPTLLIFYFLYFLCHWIQRIQWKHLEKTPLGVFTRSFHL